MFDKYGYETHSPRKDGVKSVKNTLQRRVGGISANKLVMPIVLALSVLHVMIVVVIILINTSSSQLSTLMQNAGNYTQEATSLLAGSSLLSETASNYVLAPLTEIGEPNLTPLMGYANELKTDAHRGPNIVENFKTYDVDPAAFAQLEEASNCAQFMITNQIHALSLVRSVYPWPEIQPLPQIPMVELTEEELAMDDEARMAAARTLVLGTVYGLNKQGVSQNVNGCVAIIQQQSAQQSAVTGRRVAIYRSIMWTVTLSVIVILIGTFATLYTQILIPLEGFVQLIPENRFLNETQGFGEVRMVAGAYNDVLKRRDALDAILRSAAETDALTNLPNRYRFEQYLLEAEESGYSAAVLLFDVNYLKRTNDTLGHLAGDRLIRSAANCISSCFGENCFRFGGDEFAAIVRDCSPESLGQMMARFEEAERRENISVSMGYAYAEEIGTTNYKKLLDEADKNMYAQKQLMHGRE